MNVLTVVGQAKLLEKSLTVFVNNSYQVIYKSLTVDLAGHLAWVSSVHNLCEYSYLSDRI